MITVRLDEKLKGQFEEIVDDLGLNMASAITVFVKAVVREERIPFELSRKKDSFYSLANMAALKESIAQDRREEVITFGSVAELEVAALKAIEEKKMVMSIEDYNASEELKLRYVRDHVQEGLADIASGKVEDGDAFFQDLIAGKYDAV
jgi:DNA-damage-inducible protein J